MTNKYSGRLLVVDDDQDFVTYLNAGLSSEGFICDLAESFKETRKLLSQFSYDAILLDIFLGATSSLSHIPEIIRTQPYAKILVMTANASVQKAVEAMGSGAADFIEKTNVESNIIDRIKAAIRPKISMKSLGNSAEINNTGIIGSSEITKIITDKIVKLKDLDSTVLILGESGCGKELIARALHNLSSRKNKQFEAINCAAIPESLIESELFGHKKGAFTDAKNDKKGLFEACSEGTLFLDEIGDMPISLQVKLLRVLQEKEIKPLGATTSIPVTTRVIAATNRDLASEVRNKKFREDLYYRLSVFVITTPPLRSRPDDIPDLVSYYLDFFNRQYCKNILPPRYNTMSRLKAYYWPGNVRELKHSIERAVVLSSRETLDFEDILQGETLSLGLSYQFESAVYAEAKELFEKNYLQKILHLADGNVSEAARLSGRFRSDIYRMMKRYNIEIN